MSGPSFRRLAENLGRLKQVRARVATKAAANITVLIADQFARGRDPYGAPWAPLLPQTVRRKRGDTRILIRSGVLDPSSFARARRGAGIELLTLPFGGFHQSGTKHMTSRSIFPDRGSLPRSWQLAIERATSEAIGAVMRGQP